MILRMILLACMAALWTVTQMAGQTTSATLYIEVTDPSDAVIRGATVVLKERSTSAARTQSCDDLGACSFTFLSPGS